MGESDSSNSKLLEARNEALQKIGRNVVNFQNMEAMLKWLNSQSMISGSASELSAVQSRMTRSVANQPMGRLVNTFIKLVYSNSPARTETSTNEKEPSFTFSFQVEATPELIRERKQALTAIVAERNKLIHQWLTDFDPGSIASCKELSATLDLQRERLLPEFELLQEMVQTFKELKDEFRRYIDSDQFLADFKDSLADGQ